MGEPEPALFDPRERSRPATIALCGLLALLGAGLPFWLLGDFDLDMADEGFLWYGVERALAGEVPLREFQAYDPGRYYWCAAWTPLFGSGILGVRAAAAVFQALGLFLGALVCRRIARSPLGLVVATAVLWAWMSPRHKLFEPALALAVVYTAVRLIERPTARMHLVAGIVTGFLAWFGRNHALYAGVSFVALAAYLAWKLRPAEPWRLAAGYALGVVLGSAPLWGMLLFVPGFANGYLGSLRLNLHHGANITLSFPWPWTVPWGNLQGLELLGTLALALAFLLPFVLLPLGAFVVLRSRREDLPRRAVVLAATFVGATYVHHVSARSDPAHLAQCIHPLLILALALPDCFRWGSARLPRVLVWSALGALTVFAAVKANRVLIRLAGAPGEAEVHAVRGEELRLPANLAGNLTALEEVIAERVPEGDALFVAPMRPMLYPVLAKRSPTWWLCFFWRADEREQRRTIEELEQHGVQWALIFTSARLDDRDELLFENSNPLVWRYLMRTFEPVSDARLPTGNLLLSRGKSRLGPRERKGRNEPHGDAGVRESDGVERNGAESDDLERDG